MKKAAKMKAEKPKQLSRVKLTHLALKHGGSIKDYCVMCGSKIKVQIFKGTGICSENCRKDRDDDHAPARALNP